MTQQPFTVTLTTAKPGLRIYIDGTYRGRSPVVLDKELVVHRLEGGIQRWFIDGVEVDAGGSWPLRAETFRQGVRVPVEVRVPFNPQDPSVNLELSP